MKKVLLFIAATLMVATTVMAQPKHRANKQDYSPETVAMMRADKLEKELNLTATEKKALITLFTKQETERRAKMEARQKEAQATMEKNDADMKKIIGEERFAQYTKQREEKMKARMENAHKGAKGKACNGMGEKRCDQPCKSGMNQSK